MSVDRLSVYYEEAVSLIPMNAQEFIENAPLYTRIAITNFSPPASITRECDRKDCKKDTTWLKVSKIRSTIEGTRPEIDLQYVAYQCGLCRNNSFGVVYELLNWSGSGQMWSHKAVRKVGQVPAQEVAIPAELANRLGTTASHYKRALICREQNYGIAAMAYLRRVVDEQTDSLIDVMADLSRTYGVTEEEIAALTAIKTEVQYKTKLETAATLIPQAIRPGGINPLGQLYKHTSIGLHNKTDEECIAIFDDLKADFEYVFRNLHLQAEERRQYANRVQSRAGQL